MIAFGGGSNFATVTFTGASSTYDSIRFEVVGANALLLYTNSFLNSRPPPVYIN